MPHPPTGILLGGVAGCPPPAAIAEQLHAQQGRVQAGPCQPPMGVVGRSVGEGKVTTQAVTGCPAREGGVTVATGDTHRSSPTQAVRSQETTPSGLRTLVPNRPHTRARIRFFAKSSLLDVSDHCTPTPWLSMSTTTASVAST